MFLCDPTIVLFKPISGQDFYLRAVIESFKSLGYSVLVYHPKDLSSNIYKLLNHEVDVHLHYVDLRTLIKVKSLIPKSRLHLYVYQFNDPSWGPINKLKYWTFLGMASLFINDYIVTSRFLMQKLRLLSRRRIRLVEPYYPCDSSQHTLHVKEKIESLRSNNVLLLYVGRINPWRIDISLLLRSASLLSKKGFHVRLTLISMKEMGMPYEYLVQRFNGDRLVIEFIGKRLNPNEKAAVYSRAHILMMPMKGYSAMSPPLSVIEGICYGVIPITSQIVAQDLSLPHELILRRLDENDFVQKIESVIPEYAHFAETLFDKFKRFYELNRFLSQVKAIVGEDND